MNATRISQRWAWLSLIVVALLLLESMPLAHHHHEEEHVCVEEAGGFRSLEFEPLETTEETSVSALDLGHHHDHPVCGLCFLASSWNVSQKIDYKFEQSLAQFASDWYLAHLSVAALMYPPRGPPALSSRRTV